MDNSAFDDIDDSAFLTLEMPVDEAEAMTGPPSYAIENNDSVSKTPQVFNPYSKNINHNSKRLKTEKTPSPSQQPQTLSAPGPSAGTQSRDPEHKSNAAPFEKDGFDQALRGTLERYFGHSTFRAGQTKVLRALLQDKRDVSVFWATGRGKSLCYQLPALHGHLTSIVVSPLISLMQDQCHKLNSLCDVDNGRPIATYLGGAQADASMDYRALVMGEFKIVYVTPEKLMSGDTMGKIAELHASKGLCCIAVDEAHCVSEWGHDFRPDYRQLHQLRTGPYSAQLRDVPIITLTATAVPRVQNDISRQLRLQSPLVDVQSFDRPNLNLRVRSKPSSGGYQKALQPLIQLFASLEKEATSQETAPNYPSTIIYVPTKSQVEEMASWLSNQLLHIAPRAKVGAYHASQTQQKREGTHTAFLVGQMHIIVATIAFGMGIDKPDIRRVIHFGPPKCMEAYMQQVGRAGRDGLTSECCMFCSDADFNRLYSHEMNDHSQSSQMALGAASTKLASTKTLQQFANDTVTCRRAALLRYLKQEPPFGERCGTCDNCLNVKRHGNDLERNMAPEARVVLRAVSGLKPRQSMGTIEKVVKGSKSTPEEWRYRFGTTAPEVQHQVEQAKKCLPLRRKRYPASFYKELVPLLVERGYLEKALQKGGGDYKTTWAVYSMTPKGSQALVSSDEHPSDIVLSVPTSLREIEAEEEQKRQATLSKLKKAGVDLSQIPKDEIETGDGECITAHRCWMNKLEQLKQMGPPKAERLQQLLALRQRIEQWRSDTAVKYRMSPANVMQEHLVAKVAYTASASSVPIKADALVAVGVRTAAVHALVDILKKWCDEANRTEHEQGMNEIASSNGASTTRMVFPLGEVFTPPKPWKGAVYKPNKKTGKASWESSYDRFRDGEDVQTIAINPENGRPIQIATVVAHVLDGLLLGKAVALDRIAEASPPPTQNEWNTLEDIVNGNSETMNILDDATVKMSDILRPVMGEIFMETPYKERTEAEAATYRRWCEACKWFLVLKRIGYCPLSFGDVCPPSNVASPNDGIDV